MSRDYYETHDAHPGSPTDTRGQGCSTCGGHRAHQTDGGVDLKTAGVVVAAAIGGYALTRG